MEQNIINILIADDHELVLQGIKSLLEANKNFEVVGISKNGLEALEVIKNQKVDILITDIDMPLLNGMELSKILKENHPNIKIAIITMHTTPWLIKKLNNAGIKVIISKNSTCTDLEIALEALVKGEEFLSNDIKESILNSVLNNSKRNTANDFNVKLTDREVEILKLIAEECSTNEISQKLFISVNTVETHRKNMLIKFGAKNSVGLIKAAIERNIL